MRKFNSFFFGMIFVLGFAVQAQAQIEVLYTEDFSAEALPAGWSVYDLDGLTPNAGVSLLNGTWTFLNGLALSSSWYTPAGISNDWMVTGALTIPETDPDSEVFLVWDAAADDPNFPDGYQVWVSTTGNVPDSFSTMVFETPAATAGALETKSVSLADFEGEDIYVAFVNNSNDQFVLIIDNVSVVKAGGTGLALVDDEKITYLAEGNPAVYNVTFTNIGANPLDSVQIIAEINGTDQYSFIAELATSASFFESFVVGLDLSDYLSLGGNSVTVTGVRANETLLATDTVGTDLYIYTDAEKVDNQVLAEVFTSSTCAPCLPGNTNFQAWLETLASPPIYIKYQQNFPGVGDPYVTDEAVARRGFYGINSIPDLVMNGVYSVNPATAANLNATLLNNARSVPGLFNLEVEYEIKVDSQRVSMHVEVDPTITGVLEGTKLYVAIAESITKQNVASNGETEFYHVFKKFAMPEGMQLPADASDVTFDMDYYFPGNYRLPADGTPANRINVETEHSVEEFDNLIVFAWVQDEVTGQILQSMQATNVSGNIDITDNKNKMNVFPNVIQEDASIQIELEQSDDIQLRITDMSGRLVKDFGTRKMDAGAHQFTWNPAQSGYYIVQLYTTNGYIGREVIVTK